MPSRPGCTARCVPGRRGQPPRRGIRVGAQHRPFPRPAARTRLRPRGPAAGPPPPPAPRRRRPGPAPRSASARARGQLTASSATSVAALLDQDDRLGEQRRPPPAPTGEGDHHLVHRHSLTGVRVAGRPPATPRPPPPPRCRGGPTPRPSGGRRTRPAPAPACAAAARRLPLAQMSTPASSSPANPPSPAPPPPRPRTAGPPDGRRPVRFTVEHVRAPDHQVQVQRQNSSNSSDRHASKSRAGPPAEAAPIEHAFDHNWKPAAPTSRITAVDRLPAVDASAGLVAPVGPITALTTPYSTWPGNTRLPGHCDGAYRISDQVQSISAAGRRRSSSDPR